MQKEHKADQKNYKENKKRRELITKEKRIKEQREGITRFESPSPRPCKQLSQVQCSF